jgi:SP family sugar:H+ symporter-like MFS transporter
VSSVSARTFFGSLRHLTFFFQFPPNFIYLGALLTSPFANYPGRKRAIIASCLVFTIGITLRIAATTIVIGRVFGGLRLGLISVLVPLYQSECAPKWICGDIASRHQSMIALEMLVSNVFIGYTEN